MATVTISTRTRFAAHELKSTLLAAQRWRIAGAIEYAAQAEGYPHSYTADAVIVGERTLIAAAEAQMETLASLAERIYDMRDKGTWFARDVA